MGPGDTVASTAPGRVVVLVDNAVDGDSRVQKIAYSAAAAGWRVTLLGRSPDGHPHEWRLGGAQVRLLPMPDPLAGRRNAVRRALLHALGSGGPTRPAPATAGAAATDSPLPGRVAARPGARSRALTALRRARRPVDRASARFWLAVMGDRAWRRLEPGLWDWERAYGPVIDELAPDLVHANDFRMLGVGARAKARAQAAGRTLRLVWDAHEFLPGVRPWRDNARWLPANRAHEREYASAADAVVTVSPTLAELLQREHGLARTPTVVLNAPATDHAPGDREVPDLRALCGVDAATPLLVYSGAALEQRGLATMVDALPELSGCHVALVVDPTRPHVGALRERAHRLGVADRVHVLAYVPHWQVVPFLAGADVGVIPLHHWPNHEIALVTKFFEYAHARLPLVVSDVRTMADTVRATGQGEVFTAGDVADYVRAVRRVLADPARYRAAYDAPGLLSGWTWQAQAGILDGVYRGLLAGSAPAAGTAEPSLTPDAGVTP